MKKELIAKGHITNPGHMTIVEAGDQVVFYTGKIGVSNALILGQTYKFDVNFKFEQINICKTDNLTLPNKIYDFEKPFRDQILKSLRTPHANMNIGVLLEGYKGQGKSVIAALL